MPLDPLEITGGLAIGEGLGGAIADTVEPRLQSFKNGQWQAHPDKPLDAAAAAEVAAENYDTYADMAREASFTGFDSDRFLHLYDVTLTGPGVGELLAMLRRSDEVGIDFTHGLRKAKLEPQWDDALRNLANQRLAATDIAYMVVRGVLPDEGLLGLSLPTHADKLKLPPQHSLNPITEAARTGWDADRLAMMVARSGLAMAPVMAAQANFRGILTDNDYLLTIARGDLFPAYADPVREVAREIPTAKDAVEWQLRGFTDRAGRLALTDLHGMTNAHSDVLYDVTGRAPSDRQVYIGLARGAKYPSTYADVPEPFRSAIQRSNIRPEWASIVYENRYSLPSAFVVRTLLTDGAIDAARGQAIFEHSGWPQDLAQLVADHYGAQTTATADSHVTKAQNQLWTTIHGSYKAGEITAAQAEAALPHAGVAAGAVAEVVAIWDVERSLPRKTLTAAQIKKAYGNAAVNEATGVAWTRDEALAALIELGYATASANDYLNI